MAKKAKSARPASRIQARQKSSTAPAKAVGKPTDRIAYSPDLWRAIKRARDEGRTADLPPELARAVKLASKITQHYSMRTWVRWTHHQKHGWWSHVASGNFDQIRFTWRDLDDLDKVHQRCLDEKHFDQELLRALDDIEDKQNALTVSIEAARNLLRRKARALLVE